MTVETSDIKKRVRRALSSQKRPTVTVLSSLLAAQDELGYLSEEAIEEIATFSDTTINEVWGVASFYSNFRFIPPGDHIVEICWGPTCHLAGASKIIERIQDYLGLKGEGETKDNRVSLKYSTCLGACTQSPVISIDHRLIGRLNPEEAHQHVSTSVKYKRGRSE